MSVAPAIILKLTNERNKQMARQKAISVKIATPKVIKALETKLAQIEKDYSSQEANEAKFQKAYKKWQTEIGK